MSDELELHYKDTADFMITTRHYLNDGIGKLEIVTRKSSSRGTNSVHMAFEEEGVSPETVPGIVPFDAVDAKVDQLKEKRAASYNRGATLSAYRRYRTEAVEQMQAACFVATQFCDANQKALARARIKKGPDAYAKSLDQLTRAYESIMAVRPIEAFEQDDMLKRQERLNAANLIENDKLTEFVHHAQMGGPTTQAFGAEMTKRAIELLDRGWESRYARSWQASPDSFAENFAEMEVYPDAFEILKATLVEGASRVFEQDDAYFALVTRSIPRVAERTCGFGTYGIMRKLVPAVDEHVAELVNEPRG